MKLASLLHEQEILAVAVEGPTEAPVFLPLNWVDLTLPASLPEILALPNGLQRCQAAAEKARQEERTVTGTLLAPVPRPGKVLCIGLNYRDHAKEAGMEIPSEPVCFGKFSSAITGPNQPIRVPSVAQQIDYEAELVVMIGKPGRDIPQADAFSHVGAYCNGNDVSARDWQIGKPGKQWLLGKTPDTFAPIGPWLVTPDEIPNPHDLSIELRVNGNLMQQGNTSDFIFGVDEVIAYVSQMMTLESGDLIFTGTPPGVGMGRNPQVWLQTGDVCEVSIAGLGTLSNPVAVRECLPA